MGPLSLRCHHHLLGNKCWRESNFFAIRASGCDSRLLDDYDGLFGDTVEGRDREAPVWCLSPTDASPVQNSSSWRVVRFDNIAPSRNPSSPASIPIFVERGDRNFSRHSYQAYKEGHLVCVHGIGPRRRALLARRGAHRPRFLDDDVLAACAGRNPKRNPSQTKTATVLGLNVSRRIFVRADEGSSGVSGFDQAARHRRQAFDC